ncbi:MAG: TMEM165/GDT1 family protein [Cellvibrionaceae bacterium]
MDWKIFSTVIVTVFIAELGDKTQLATMLFAADKAVNKWVVFAGASVALIAAAGLGVLVGSLLSQYLNEKLLNTIAGVAFIAIGAWTLYKG